MINIRDIAGLNLAAGFAICCIPVAQWLLGSEITAASRAIFQLGGFMVLYSVVLLAFAFWYWR